MLCNSTDVLQIYLQLSESVKLHQAFESTMARILPFLESLYRDYFFGGGWNNDDRGVYCILLDATKALDGVHYIRLFRGLMKRKICQLSVCLLLNLFTLSHIIRVSQK